MNISINHQSQLKPCAAIVLYHSGMDAAVIMHDIRRDGRLSAGRHLDMDMLEEIFRSSGRQGRMKFLTGNVLAIKNNSIIWYEKSRKHPINFETTEKNRQKLNNLSGRNVIWPPLIFMIRDGTLYCWALPNNRRPMPWTPLYIAPLTHINEAQGNVCLPSELSLRNGNSPFENMAMISRGFYNGVFGHATGSMKQINHPGGHDGFWLEYLQQKKQTRFPVELLKAAGKKLEDIL